MTAGPHEQQTAQRILTPKELEAWTLRNQGLSRWAITLALGISTSSLRDRLRNADRKLATEIRKDAA